MALVTGNSAKFDEIRKKLEASQKKSVKTWGSEHEIVFTPDKTYKFRLLYYINPKTSNEEPFIEKWNHAVKDIDGKWHVITCPTTQYKNSGFDKCPTCKLNNKLYENGENGIKADKALYDLFKRKYSGYAVVYVVNDPQTPENNGHVKIVRYGHTINKELQKRVFGIVKRARGQKEDPIVDPEVYVGSDAFEIGASGLDLIIEVTKPGQYNDYAVSFARRPYALTLDMDVLNAELEELKFGEDIKEETEERLNKFFDTVILAQVDVDRLFGEEAASSAVETDLQDMVNEAKSETVSNTSDSVVNNDPVEADVSSDVNDDIDSEVNDLLNEMNGITESKEEVEVEVEETTSETTSDSVEVDDLLADIEKQLNN